MQLRGAWADALDEARARVRAAVGATASSRPAPTRCTSRPSCTGCAASSPRPRTLPRRRASAGREPQPGLALLRLAQGQADAAAAAIRRVARRESTTRSTRPGCSPPFVEIMLAVGDVAAARAGRRRAGRDRGASSARRSCCAAVGVRGGRGALAEGDAHAALGALRARAGRVARARRAVRGGARARARSALACRELGDDDTATMELDAARRAFAQLGAAPDLARLDALLACGRPRRTRAG